MTMPTPPAQQVVARDARGRFLPGCSGNPATQFSPGESGNPAGRPAAGMSIVEWMNLMQVDSEDSLAAVANDSSVPVNKRVAALRWLAAIRGDPERDAREAVMFLCNYTNGRPHQTATIHHSNPTVGEDIRYTQLVSGDPRFRALANEFQQRVDELRDDAVEVKQVGVEP